jgi:ADP-heptose:LPS heptosyltransferase
LLDVTPVLARVEPRFDEVLFPGEPWPEVRRILVVRNDRLGDLVLTLPAIRALREAYPASWIALLVRPSLVPLAEMVPDGDQVIADPGDSGSLVHTMEQFRADLAICISRDARSSWAAWKAGIPRRVGTGFRLYSPLFHRRVDEHRHAGIRHEVEHALAFAHRAGASQPDEVRFPLRIPGNAEESVRNWLELQKVTPPFVILHPGSGGSCPAWPLSHYIELATLLEAEGIPVVFTLGSQDEVLHEVLDGEHPAIRRRPRFSGDLDAMAALQSCGSAVIGSSTGPVHLAAALGTPVLAFHAPWPSCGVRRWGPYSDRGWALVADLEEATHWSRRRRRRLGERLMAGIPPTSALRCIRGILQGRDPELEESPAEGEVAEA